LSFLKTNKYKRITTTARTTITAITIPAIPAEEIPGL